jgi:tRNA 5-methylaminomethyl-2-thiouridine biosynthesis bifunctional protein
MSSRPLEPWFEIPDVTLARDRAVAIIGGGLAGTALAYELAQKNWTVTLLEQEKELASHASGASSLNVLPLLGDPKDPLTAFTNLAFQSTLDHLKELSQADSRIQYPLHGLLHIGSEQKLLKRFKKYTLDTPIFSAEDCILLSQKEASLKAGIEVSSESVFYLNGGEIQPKLLCQARVEAMKSNIQVQFYKEIDSLALEDGQWITFNPQGEPLSHSSILILANALEAKRFCQTTELPLFQARGQVAFLPRLSSGEGPRYPLSHRGYVSSGIQSDFFEVGATFDRDLETKTLIPEQNNELIENLSKAVPGFKKTIEAIDPKQLQGRVGFRARTPDRLPLIGPVPNFSLYNSLYKEIRTKGSRYHPPPAPYFPGLYVSAGHGARGSIFTQLAALTLSRLISNEPLPISLPLWRALHPARFWIRKALGRHYS